MPKGDSGRSGEAIHLVAGMLVAGYGDVVGTMWSILDDAALVVVEKIYEYLINEAGGDGTRAAYTLHDAVAHLRYIRGERDFASWMPLARLGIYSISSISA